jgi:hypothetical protein
MKTRDRRWGDLQSWMPARDILDEAQSPQEQAEQILKALEIEPASAILLTAQCTQLAYEGKLDASIQSCAALDANPVFTVFTCDCSRCTSSFKTRSWRRRILPAASDQRTCSKLRISPRASELPLERAASARPSKIAYEIGCSIDAGERRFTPCWNRGRALTELSEAVAGHEFSAAFIGAELAFRDLHGEPAFQALLKKIGLPLL